MPLTDHPLRYPLANELHARPFPVLQAPAFAAFLAIKAPEDAAGRDRAADLAHLTLLLDRHGAPHPQPGATHWFGQVGRYQLKWESHTEFVTYTILGQGLHDKPFDPTAFEVFPQDWLAAAPGVRITSALVRVEVAEDDADVADKLATWFVPESLAMSAVLDDAALIAGDFRIDPGGHMRLAVFVRPGTGPQRTGRIVQRLTEIETYKAMAMLGLARARAMGERMSGIDRDLSRLIAEMSSGTAAADTLAGLLAVSAELERMVQGASFRFGATAAYEALVLERISALRETRWQGRQTFGEFMARRFDPAMRTVKSTESRLMRMTEAASRAGELLRTRVDVERSAQNQKLLESMDHRADLQLRLQQTVEGLSVVAIAYYALGLAAYLVEPVAEAVGVGKPTLMAVLVVPVLLVVWAAVRALRRRLH
jgi:uncharacterized membrane-anchored protein